MGSILDIRSGSLRIRAYETRMEMGERAAMEAADRLKKIITEKGTANAVFAAAPSQNEFLASLLRQDVDWTKVRAFHMDEYIGLKEDASQGFGNFLKAAIFDIVDFAEIYYLNGQASDPQAECERYAGLLEKYPPDIVFLGIGENGHLAFNDPGVADFNDSNKVKVVELDDVCRNQQVNDGCFVSLADVPKKALTLTMSALIDIPDAIAVVPGETKKDAVTSAVRGPVTTECPASVLQRRQNAVMYLDRESAADLL